MNAKVEVVEEEVEGVTKIFITIDNEELYNKLYDVFWEVPKFEVWTEDVWSEEEEGVFVVELTKNLLLYFILKTEDGGEE